MKHEKTICLISFILIAVNFCFAQNISSIEVKGFDSIARVNLPEEIKNRSWTEVRSPLYDGEGNGRLYVVLPPSNQARAGTVASTFNDFDQWVRFAEKHRTVLVFPDPGEDLIWNSDDIEYLNALFIHCSKYRVGNASHFIAAYGDAGIPASIFAVSNTQQIAGAAFIEAEIADINDTKLAKSKLPLTVCLINTQENKAKNLIEFFKKNNEANTKKVINKNEYLYFKEGFSAWNSDYSKSHFIRIINKTKEKNPALIFNNLFNAVARWKTIAGQGTLRQLEREGQIDGLVKIQENTNPARSAFVYTPPSIRSGKAKGPFPIVMVFHGRRCTGDYIIDQTQWHKVADENNIIIYAPNGLDYNWNIFDKEELADDYSYFSGKVEEFGTGGINIEGKTYKIDSSRVYVFGYSNGAYFTSGLIMKYPEKFAAAAFWAGGLHPEKLDNKSEMPLPVWFGIGEKDHYFKSWEEEFTAMGNYFISKAHADTTKSTIIYYPAFGIENLIKTTVYNGIVEVRDSRAKKIEHGCINELTKYFWDDFLSKYKKQNGVSVLQNQ